MKKLLKLTFLLALAASLVCGALTACGAPGPSSAGSSPQSAAGVSASASSAATTQQADSGMSVSENGEYSDKDHVALYIHKFGHLPSNYVSKTKARKAGWVSTQGNLWEVLPGKSIGGSEFYNDDEILPEASGRRWTECDIGYSGGYRGPERIVFSNDGLVFYTKDHYETFEQLY